MCINSFVCVCVSYQQRLCLNWCQTKIVPLFFSGEEDSLETYILLISLKVVVTTVTKEIIGYKNVKNVWEFLKSAIV